MRSRLRAPSESEIYRPKRCEKIRRRKQQLGVGKIMSSTCHATHLVCVQQQVLRVQTVTRSVGDMCVVCVLGGRKVGGFMAG